MSRWNVWKVWKVGQEGREERAFIRSGFDARMHALAFNTKVPRRQCRIMSRLLGMQNRQNDRRKAAAVRTA
eukprot:COSAG02_NODE_1944_length_10307_cov_7.826019_6_plen_71_part_00